jgi:hypothetical protein
MSTTPFVNMCDGKTVLQFADRNRLFDPTEVPRYANDLGQPYLLLKYNPILQFNHMHVGFEYRGHHIHDGIWCADRDTVVMAVGGLAMDGFTVAARWFGKESKYNRQSLCSGETLDIQVLSMVCAGKLSRFPQAV